MKFEEFLKWHSDIQSRAMNGQTVVNESDQFVREINICIDAHADIGKGLDGLRRRWMEQMNTLCHLRDTIQKTKDKK